MKFEEFRLVLHVVGDELLVTLHESSYGETPPRRVSLPSSADVGDLAAGFERLRDHRDFEVVQPTQKRLARRIEELGDRLGSALLVGEVRDRFARCSAHPLRLRLQMPISSGGALLHSTPWECLRLPGRGFAAVDESLSLVRHIPAQGRDVAPPHPGRIVVLLVASQAPGHPPLDLEGEIKELLAVERPGLHFERLEAPSLDRLRERLSGDPVHVVHFIGHGGLDADDRCGVVLLERTDGGVDAVSGERLATALRPARSLRLLFLNACRTAANVAEAPSAGVATAAILLAGVPAVIAMQYPIPDREAVRFASRVYRRLAAGRGLERAVVEARQRLYHEQTAPTWVVPVLFSRLQDGDLFASPRTPRWRRWLAAAGVALAMTLGLWGVLELSDHGTTTTYEQGVPQRDAVGPFALTLQWCLFKGAGDEAQLFCRLSARNTDGSVQRLEVGADSRLTDNQGDEYTAAEVRVDGRRLPVAADVADATAGRQLAPGEEVEVMLVFDAIWRFEKKARVLRVRLGDLGTAEFEGFWFSREPN